MLENKEKNFLIINNFYVNIAISIYIFKINPFIDNITKFNKYEF